MIVCGDGGRHFQKGRISESRVESGYVCAAGKEGTRVGEGLYGCECSEPLVFVVATEEVEVEVEYSARKERSCCRHQSLMNDRCRNILLQNYKSRKVEKLKKSRIRKCMNE